MKITPVLERNDKRFVWELTDIEIPEKLQKIVDTGEYLNYNKLSPEKSLKHRETRLKLVKDKGAGTLIGNLLKPAVQHVLNSNYYFYDGVWPAFFIDTLKQNPPLFNGQVVKDLPGHAMSTHLDNSLMFASCILNLKDNDECFTEYYSDPKGEKVIYRTRRYSNKGTGVIHLNSPHLYHNGFNKGGNERLIAFCNLSLVDIMKYG